MPLFDLGLDAAAELDQPTLRFLGEAPDRRCALSAEGHGSTRHALRQSPKREPPQRRRQPGQGLGADHPARLGAG